MVRVVIMTTATTNMQLAIRISQFFSEAIFSIAIFSEANFSIAIFSIAIFSEAI